MSPSKTNAPPSPPDAPTESQALAWRADWELVQRCVEGERAAWVELLERYERTLYFAVLNTLRAQSVSLSNDRVADIQGDLIVALAHDDFRKLRRYSGRSKLAQWLKVVASHYTIDVLRRQRPTLSLDAAAELPTRDALHRALQSQRADHQRPDHAIQRRETLNALRSLCDQLPREDQRFVQLFYREERSFQEIAELMGTTLDAVYTRKNRIRHRLLRLAHKRGLLDA